MRKVSTKTSIPTEEMLEDMLADLIDENRAISAQDENGTGISMYGNRPQHRKSNSKKPYMKKGQSDKHYTHCNKNGHIEQNCYIKYPGKREEYIRQRTAKNEDKPKNTSANAKINPFILMAHHIKSLKSSDWILDTRASHHMCNDRTMFNEYKVNTNPANTIATARANTRAAGYGTVTITAIQTDNSTAVLKLENVFHMPSLGINLLSRLTIMAKGMYINGLTHTIRQEYNKLEICKFQSL
jgi:hypothetical protein